MRSKTAMHRNFIRTPRLIAGFMAFTVGLIPIWLGIVFGVDELTLVALVLVGTVMCVASASQASQALTNARVEAWADEYHGIAKEDVVEWMDSMEADELDEMIMMDLEVGRDYYSAE